MIIARRPWLSGDTKMPTLPNNNRRRRRTSGNPSGLDGSKDYNEDSDDQKKSRNETMVKLFVNACLGMVEDGKLCCRNLCRRKKLKLPLSNGATRHSERSKGGSQQEQLIIGGAVFFALYCLWTFFSAIFSFSSFQYHHLRPETDAQVNQLSVLIPKLDFTSVGEPGNIGGWLFNSEFYHPSEPLEPSMKVDRGDLKMRSVGGGNRDILPSDPEIFEAYRKRIILNDVKTHMSFDNLRNEELEDRAQTCRRPNWTLSYYPTCNAVHEVDLSLDFDKGRVGLGDEQIFDDYYIRYVVSWVHSAAYGTGTGMNYLTHSCALLF
jgi:hypothetical protein